MRPRIRNLLFILLFLLGMIPGYFIGHWAGKLDGETMEKATTAIEAGKESVKVIKQREVIDDETRKMSDPDLIRDMRSNGWLRD